MLFKIVSLSCVALAASQVQIEGTPEWQAYKNAELAHIAPSIGPLANVGVNFAQEQLNWQQQQLVHQQNALNFVASGAGRRKRQVQVVGSPEWQAYKNAELAHIAPSVGPLAASGVNFAQEQLNWLHQQNVHQQNALKFVASGAGRRKRQVQVEGSPEWQAYKNAELAFIAPSVGPTPINYAQSALNFVGPAPGPTPDNFAQSALDFVGPAPGPTPVNYAQSSLDFVGPAPGPTPVNYAQSALDFVAPAPDSNPVSHTQALLNYQQEALNFVAGK